MAIHVLSGEKEFVEAMQREAAQGQTARWIVPKAAAPGDNAILFFPSAGFLGHGEIVSSPESTVFGRRSTYGADVGNIVIFKSPIPLDAVANQFPKWKWASYPRSYTTPPPELAGQIFAFLLAYGRAYVSEIGQSPRGAVQGTVADDLDSNSPHAFDLAPPTSRVETKVSRIVRDTALSNRVKALHSYECQICGHTIILADGSRYAEGHHIRPLGSPHDGPDVLENIVCLCPNHHAVCDLGAVRLLISELRLAKGHRLNQRFLDYHNESIFKG